MSVKRALCAMVLAATALTAPVASAAKAAGTSASARNEATLRGKVVTTGKAPIPANASVSVLLEDVSLADAPAITLGKTEFAPVGKSPYVYTLRYDPKLIRQGHRYSLRADIRAAGKLLYMSKTETVQADAVPTETTIKVDSVTQTVPEAVSGAWVISLIGTQKTVPEAPAFMVIRPDGALSGTGGCNRMMGNVTADATHLSFGPVASTQMACLGVSMKQEGAIFKAMEAVKSWHREGSNLILTNDQNEAQLTLTLQESKSQNPTGHHSASHSRNSQ